MEIHVHIGQVVLEGLDWRPVQRAQFERAFTGELSRLLATGSLTVQAGAVPFTRAPDVALSARPTPHRMGIQIAQSIFKSMRTL